MRHAALSFLDNDFNIIVADWRQARYRQRVRDLFRIAR